MVNSMRRERALGRLPQKAEKALPHGRTTAISPAGPELDVFSVLRAAFTKEPLAWCAATLKCFAGMAHKRHCATVTIEAWPVCMLSFGPKGEKHRAAEEKAKKRQWQGLAFRIVAKEGSVCQRL